MKLNCFEVTLSLVNARAAEILKVVRDLDMHLRARLKLDENGLTLHWRVQDTSLEDGCINRKVEARVSVIRAVPASLYNLSTDLTFSAPVLSYECLASEKVIMTTYAGDEVAIQTDLGRGMNCASDLILGGFSMVLPDTLFRTMTRDDMDKIVQQANAETFGDANAVRS